MHKDSPVFDHGKVGERLPAERRDQAGDEDWHDPEEDEGFTSQPYDPAKRWLTGITFAEDSLFHPDRPFIEKTVSVPPYRRGG